MKDSTVVFLEGLQLVLMGISFAAASIALLSAHLSPEDEG